MKHEGYSGENNCFFYQVTQNLTEYITAGLINRLLSDTQCFLKLIFCVTS